MEIRKNIAPPPDPEEIVKSLHSVLVPLESEEDKLTKVASSPTAKAVYDVLGAGGSLQDYPRRKAKINRHTTIVVTGEGSKRQVYIKSSKSEVTLQLSDSDLLAKANKGTKKLFLLILAKVLEQSFHNGVLIRDYISFPLKELIDRKLYSTVQSARTGFKNSMLALKTISTTEQSKSNPDFSCKQLFPEYNIENNQCTVYLWTRADWGAILRYFTILPWYFADLSSRALDLLFNLMYLARQHTRDIATKGYYIMTFRNIHGILQLPSEKGNTRPQQTIRTPIEQVITEINEAQKRTYNNNDLSLEAIYDEDSTITTYLNNGRLKVTLKGSFAEAFLQIDEKKGKKIEYQAKRKKNIEDKAKAINLAKKLERETNKEDAGD